MSNLPKGEKPRSFCPVCRRGRTDMGLLASFAEELRILWRGPTSSLFAFELVMAFKMAACILWAMLLSSASIQNSPPPVTADLPISM